MKVRNSRKTYLSLYVMALILIAIIVWIKYRGLPLSNLSFVLAIVFILLIIKYSELHRLSNSYEITNRSLVHIKGLLNKKTRNLDFFAISDIDFKQNVWQRLLNFGNVDVHLYSRETNTSVKNINKPEKFASFLQKMINARRGQNVNW